MPHEDGNAYAEVVATVSLGASLCLEISDKSKADRNDANLGGPSEQQDVKEQEKSIALEDERKSAKVVENAKVSSSSPYKVPTRILQEPRSLLITTGSAYKGLLHGISPVEVDENLNADTIANWSLLGEPLVFEEAGSRNERATRVSLTYRDVLKVSSAASKVLGGPGKR